MRFSQLNLQTLRDAPANSRSAGFAFLVRAGYLSREKEVLFLGQQAINQLKNRFENQNMFQALGLTVLANEKEVYFLSEKGQQEIIHCAVCGYVSGRETALFTKTVFSQESPLPLEEVTTPNCNTIESLAAYLNIPKHKTAKALMFTRLTDGKLIFAVVRGDQTLSEEKLMKAVGAIRLASPSEIESSGAVAGYASPINLKDAFIVVDDLIATSPNLTAGANRFGYHLINTNCGRDYAADLTADLVLANDGDLCINCRAELKGWNADVLMQAGQPNYLQILLSVAETHWDEKGLTLPAAAAPFDVHIVALLGKEMDTVAEAIKLQQQLQSVGLRVLLDDRDERAGVKFNDADLIGCPIRLTVGERGLREGMVELKYRAEAENKNIPLADVLRLIS